MESRFKLRISRMFRSSFGSCRSRNISDVIETPVFVPQNRQHHQLIELFSPKPRPFPSICRPKCSETDETVDHSCIITKELFPIPRRKVSDRNSLLFGIDKDGGGRNFPPASPISPLKKTTHSSKKAKKKTHLRNKNWEKDQLGHFMADYYKGWFSSDDDETTLFSSKSLTSDSSDSFRRNKARRRQKRGATRKEMETSLMPLDGNVKDSFAVVKRSSDPYNDFRTSMVEMIVEKHIFAAKDLENLLQCFLSLNSYHHHGVIIEVFTEIWEALFSNWS